MCCRLMAALSPGAACIPFAPGNKVMELSELSPQGWVCRGRGGAGRSGAEPAEERGGASRGRAGFCLATSGSSRRLWRPQWKMAAPWWRAALFASGRCRGLSTSASLSRRTPPLGPMPNEHIDVSNLERLEKYRSFERYRRRAEQEARAPHWWRTYREHFVKETDPKDKIDIGLPPSRVIRTQQLQDRKHFIRELRANVEEERAARLRTASISLEAVRAEWERTCGPYHKQRLAEYYGLYQDLFHGATFVPRVPLHVAYAVGEEDLVPVYHGNEVTPAEASQAPEVTYEADKDSLWTLLLTNLDGHLLEPDAEYVHWLLTNIPSNRVAEGQETCPYLPPFPARGSGFHRFAFLLFKQDKPINFSEDMRPSP
ncbi:39S ribosomal protein L38, mitochondrial isoform X2 [Onychomys torridus]|nr:39S ribosomal protein L38, mitochondrial isoform X2 [Onychomys torridus]